MTRNQWLSSRLEPVIINLIERGKLTYNSTTGKTDIVIGTRNGYKPMKVMEGGWFTSIEMPDGSAILIDRRKPMIKGERGR